MNSIQQAVDKAGFAGQFVLVLDGGQAADFAWFTDEQLVALRAAFPDWQEIH